nr:DUF397 domain-containing protein [Streptomyces sp. CoH27]
MTTFDNWRKSSYSGGNDGNDGNNCVEVAARWRKSSYSGPGDGNSCVEISDHLTHISLRDSKAPALGTLTFPAEAFAPFLRALKDPTRPTVG